MKIRSRCMLLIGVMGPGLLTAMADNDAGGIAMYMQAGGTYGYVVLVIVLISIVCLAVCQELSARTGVASGQGLASLIRERYGVGWSLFVIGILLVANLGTTMAEFAGIAIAGSLIGLPVWVSVCGAGIVLMGMAIWCCYRSIERILLLLCLTFVSYFIAGYAAVPSGEDVVLSCLQADVMALPFWLMAVGVIGTTVTPWGQFYLQSSVVDKGIGKAEYPYVRADVLLGSCLTGIIALAIVCIGADVFWQTGTPYTSLEQSIDALRPIFDDWAVVLFGIGLFGASFLASFILPLSTAYAACEAFGLEYGLDRSLGEAPFFFGIYCFVLLGGMIGALCMTESLLLVILIPQIANGILLLPILFFMVMLAQDRMVMGTYRNGRWQECAALLVLVLLVLSQAGLLLTVCWG